MIELVEKYAGAMISTAKQHKINKELTQKMLEKGKSEGLSDKTIKKLIEEALKRRGLADRTIRKLTPKPLKNQNMIRSRIHYIKNEGIKLPDIPPNSTVFLGEPVFTIPSKIYAPLKTMLIMNMANKIPEIKVRVKDGVITDIL